jgi:hypothetical protein
VRADPPSASDFVSATAVIGRHSGTSRLIAPGWVCNAKTSSSGWSTTLSNSMPMFTPSWQMLPCADFAMARWPQRSPA